MAWWAFGTDPVETFIWFAPEDALFLAALENHLSPLTQDTPVSFWHGGKVAPGDSVAEERARRLRSAEVFLALISVDLLASPQFQEEATIAFHRRDQAEVTIVPIVLRPCDWRSTALAELEPLPRSGVPVGSPGNDAAWMEVVAGLRALLGRPGPPPGHG